MIVQGILDFFSQWIAGLVSLVPPMPSEMSALLSDLASGGADIASGIALFGPVIPFDVIGGVLVSWGVLVGFWAVLLGVRFVLWIVAH